MQAAVFFERLWSRYVEMAPQAQKIHDQVESSFGPVFNDHVAFRTFDRPGYSLVDIEFAFLNMGYRKAESYDFAEKHLQAYSYLPPHDGLPRVFLSQLLSGKFSHQLQQVVEQLLSDPAHAQGDPAERLLQGRPWPMPTQAQYQQLLQESAYAAWLSVWGLCANHFTVAVHQLQPLASLQQVVESLQASGIEMNPTGGVIKGSAEQLLEQASTLAELRPVQFSRADHSEQGSRHSEVGSCYYEFARRHCDAQGQLYQGFVAASANHIFESTTVQTRDTHGKEKPQ